MSIYDYKIVKRYSPIFKIEDMEDDVLKLI